MNEKKVVASNFIWRFAERCGAQGITFIVSIILARLLDPEVYGTVALVTVFTNIVNVFIDSGLGNALIQKKDADDVDFSSVFYFNFVVCLILYGIMFISAPLIASFYDMPILTAVLRVLSLTLIISGLKNIQLAYVSKRLLFKRFFFSTLGGTIAAAFVGIIMAYHGFGVWALVVQLLVNNAIDSAILWITVKWRPKLCFSWSRLKSLLSFGYKLLLSHLIDTLYKNVRSLLIGKYYDEAALAYYNRGNQMPKLVINNTVSALDSILFPVMSKSQNDLDRLKTVTRKVNRVTAYVVWPLMIGLSVVANPLIRVLLTDKWIKCVPYLQVLSLSYIAWPISTTNLNAIKSLGRSDIFLKLEIIKKVVGISFILISIPFGPFAVAIGELAFAPVHAIVDAYPSKKLFNYSLYEQLLDILPACIMSLIMGTAVWAISMLNMIPIVTLVCQVATGVVVYIILSWITHNESFNYLLSIIRKEK